jgi:hypothetical protein
MHQWDLGFNRRCIASGASHSDTALWAGYLPARSIGAHQCAHRVEIAFGIDCQLVRNLQHTTYLCTEYGVCLDLLTKRCEVDVDGEAPTGSNRQQQAALGSSSVIESSDLKV